MNELALKYGCNPNQKPSRIYMEDGSDLPVTVLNGKPGYINFLDALNSIQLVKELKAACGLPAAASFKHVSPAGAALGLPLTDVERRMYHIAPDFELSPLACAYARARGADRMSSFGDWIALSDVCDVPTAKLIQHEVSDGIIAPGYEPEALTILAGKKKGNYNVVAIDPDYKPAPVEHKQVYGITFEQGRNELTINADTMLTNWVTENKSVTEEQKRDLIIALITLKYTQSNSVCYTAGGQTIGVSSKNQDAFRDSGCVLYFLLDYIMAKDLEKINSLQQNLVQLELEVLNEKNLDIIKEITNYRSRTMKLHHYYVQLEGILQDLEDDISDLISNEAKEYFNILIRKTTMFGHESEQIWEYTSQIRDIYQQQLDVHQNAVMKFLTVVTTLFMPLTLIVGWYGMNFEHMPELEFKYSYPIVFGFSLLLVIIMCVIFKKKKWW